MDLLEDGVHHEEIPGGSAANVALGLARRGVPVRFSTHLARDPHGLRIVDFLRAEGVQIAPSSFGAARTSTARARRDDAGEVTYTFDVDWQLPKVTLDASMALLHLGSFPAFASSIEQLVAILRQARGRMRISWDPNVRPALAPDREDAQRRFRALVPELDIVKLSEADADYLLPGMSTDGVADLLVEQGVRLAVITSAEHGLLVADRGGRVEVSAQPVRVADTIGAGDTVMTSLIADVVQERCSLNGADDCEVIGRRATMAAAITVSRKGADLPHAAELGL